jgi:hypothetical protein
VVSEHFSRLSRKMSAASSVKIYVLLISLNLF